MIAPDRPTPRTREMRRTRAFHEVFCKIDPEFDLGLCPVGGFDLWNYSISGCRRCNEKALCVRGKLLFTFTDKVKRAPVRRDFLVWGQGPRAIG